MEREEIKQAPIEVTPGHSLVRDTAKTAASVFIVFAGLKFGEEVLDLNLPFVAEVTLSATLGFVAPNL